MLSRQRAPTPARAPGLVRPGRGPRESSPPFISGLAIYLNAFAVKQVPDAAVYTTLKNGVAALMLIESRPARAAIGGPARSAGRPGGPRARRRWSAAA